jgi:regulator of RNase E activity RraA
MIVGTAKDLLIALPRGVPEAILINVATSTGIGGSVVRACWRDVADFFAERSIDRSQAG